MRGLADRLRRAAPAFSILNRTRLGSSVLVGLTGFTGLLWLGLD